MKNEKNETQDSLQYCSKIKGGKTLDSQDIYRKDQLIDDSACSQDSLQCKTSVIIKGKLAANSK